MMSFLKKIVLFFLILLFPFLIVAGWVWWKNIKMVSDYRLPSLINTIVIGDSHTQKAINPEVYPEVVNLSQSSECFNHSYYKLAAVLQKNPGVRNIILGCGYHSFSAYEDEFISGKYATELSARYFFILPLTEQWTYILANKTGIGQCLLSILSEGWTNIKNGYRKCSFLGSYETYETRVKLSSVTVGKRVKTHYFKDGFQYGFSGKNIFWLMKIRDLCRKYHVSLYVINTPLHHYYKDQVPRKFTGKYISTLEHLSVKLIDLKDLSLPDTCFLPDGDHVNDRGASITTPELKKYLENRIK